MLTCDDFVYFNSNVGLRELSNLKHAIIRGSIDPIPDAPEIIPDPAEHLYPSAEHYYVAHFAPPQDRYLFYTDGTLASYERATRACYPTLSDSSRANKIRYWRSHDMIGIFAKMYGNLAKYNKIHDLRALRILWHRILYAKFSQNPDLKRVLINTGSKILIEYDRSAIPANASQIFWGAKVIDGAIIGQNFMGTIMQSVRDSFTMHHIM